MKENIPSLDIKTKLPRTSPSPSYVKHQTGAKLFTHTQKAISGACRVLLLVEKNVLGPHAVTMIKLILTQLLQGLGLDGVGHRLGGEDGLKGLLGCNVVALQEVEVANVKLNCKGEGRGIENKY